MTYAVSYNSYIFHCHIILYIYVLSALCSSRMNTNTHSMYDTVLGVLRTGVSNIKYGTSTGADCSTGSRRA